MQIYQLDVFTKVEGEGNPAGVVPEADSLEEAMFAEIARQTCLETAFVLKPTLSEAGLRLRYFAPNGQEMNLCAHATIGTLYLLASQGQIEGSFKIETQAGLLPVRVEMNGSQVVRAVMQTPSPIFNDGPFPLDEVAKALGLNIEEVTATGLPVVAASTGRAKLLVPLENYQTLDKIEVDRPALDAFCQRFDLTGLYPFTLHPRNPGVTTEARQFPYNVGFEEDPVTGTAMGALGAYLLQYQIIPSDKYDIRFVMEQGHAIECPGRAEVFVRRKNGKFTQVEVGGVAVVVDKSSFGD
jgi:PhzF family phenazine biosynthesis protein